MGTVNFVHCVDTEGPLYESLTATFGDLKENFGIELPPSPQNLERIQRGEDIPDAQREAVMARYSKHRLAYNSDWGMIDRMHETLFSQKFRESFSDDFGSPYRLNWFCLDQVGFDSNPRRRTMGYNITYDRYAELCIQHPHAQDRIYWHFHPVAFNKVANCQGLNIQHGSEHLMSLARRLIDCHHFPAAFRPGYHQEKIDLNLFLEQWVPFDYANLNGDDHFNQGRRAFRFIDWREAPRMWQPYHPSFGAADQPGNLRRWIGRTLTLGTNFSCITKEELVAAFRAAEETDVLVSVCSHDNRDMLTEIRELKDLFDAARQETDNKVKLRFCNAVEGFVRTLSLDSEPPVRLTCRFDQDTLVVEVEGRPFGFQPFFCFSTLTGDYFHDNLSKGENGSTFFYVFDRNTVPLPAVQSVGLAATNFVGDVSIVVAKPATGETHTRTIDGMSTTEFPSKTATASK
jgi:hypothetical protein